MKRFWYKFYSLLEVIIAMAVLTLSLVTILEITGRATERTSKAQEKWNTAHRTVQAAEYFLLAGAKSGSIPAEIFPYKDCRVSCQVTEPEGLPPETETVYSGWKLALCKIQLFANDGSLLNSIFVEKILREDD